MLNSIEIKKEMILWLSDLIWADMTEHFYSKDNNLQFKDMSYIQLRRGIERHYDGGFQEFMLNI